MKQAPLFKFTLALLFCVCNTYGQDSIHYPKAIQSNQTDTIWGRAVKDPYRWMEDIKSPEVKQWLDEEKKIADKYSGRTYSLEGYLKSFSEIEFNPYLKKGKYYFFYSYLSEYQTPVLYYRKRLALESMDHLLFDPNTLGKWGTIAIREIQISKDNNTLALMLSKNGSDWSTIRFLNMNSEKLLPDSINFVKYSDVAWYKNGVFYCKYLVNNTNESFKGNIFGYTLYYHKMGNDEKQDSIIYKPQGPFSFQVSEKNHYLVIHDEMYSSGKKFYKVSMLDLDGGANATFKDFIITPKEDLYFDVLGMLGGKFLVQTNLNAPFGAIYKYDPNGLNKAQRFIGEFEQQLKFSKIMDNKIISAYDNDSTSVGVIRDTSGDILHRWIIPDGYSFSYFSGELTDSILVFGFHSFFNPPSMYQMNVNTYETAPLSKTYINYDNSGLLTRKVCYKSKDGTVIPMYLTYKKGIKLDGNNPTLLYGYGGFGINTEPFFSASNVIFIKSGGILATPCLRGGGDFPAWHEKGMRLNKQNSFDDFIAAAEYLISEKYTNPQRLAAMGGSNGGLLVGTVMLQRPDLFKVVISESGLLDMMRFQFYNIGYIWKDEYGSIKDSADFRNLLGYSPVQNVKNRVNYPATLLVAGDNDDRVNPFNSFKFLATLQAAGSSTNPYILYYQKNAGHNGSDVIEEDSKTDAFIYAFIYKYLGVPNSTIEYDAVSGIGDSQQQ